jgi:fibronectin-binding autotransporter adhesin
VNRIYRLIWSQSRSMFVPATEVSRSRRKSKQRQQSASSAARAQHCRPTVLPMLLVACTVSTSAYATPFLDFGSDLTGWTTGGSVTLTSTTSAFNIGGSPFSLTPADGYSMVRIAASGVQTSVNSTLGLSANSLESFLNNANGHITNFGLLTRTYTFDPGTYSFAWAYAAEDYQPYNDGAVFTLVGGGTEQLISLARNGSSPSDLSGPSPDTLILGSYGSTAWLTTSFTVATAGEYQVGFAAYNWLDTGLSPNLFVSAIAGTFTGTPVDTSGGPPPPPPVIGNTGGNVSDALFDTSSPAYSQPTLTFEGGTLQFTSDTNAAKDVVLNGSGGAIDTNGHDVSISGQVSGSGSLNKQGDGQLTLDQANTLTGAVNVQSGTLALTGDGSIETASGVTVDGTLDISGTNNGASVKTLAGSGTTVLGDKTLTIASASDTFSGGFAGEGSVVVAGGMLTLNGASTHTGGVSVENGAKLVIGSDAALGAASGALTMNAGTLQTAHGVTISNPILLGSGATSVHVDQDVRTTLAGDISTVGAGGACFVKSGAGSLVMSGVATIASGTCVQSGSLYSNGQLNSAVFVAETGVLRGTGIINGNTTVQGTLAPGNSPGVMLVNGEIEMLPGSVYQEDINGLGTASGPGSYSRLIISGESNRFIAGGATLAPNLVNITGADVYTPYVPQVGDAFRIITAEGGIEGEFSSIVQPDGLAAATRMEVFYNVDNSNSIDIVVTPTSYNEYVSDQGGNANAQSAAVVLDQLAAAKADDTATESQEALLYNVNVQSAGALPQTVTALSGEIHASMLAVAPLANRWLVDSVSRQLANESAPGASSWVELGAEQGRWSSDSAASGFEADRSQVAVGWNVLNGASARVGVGLLHGTADVDSRGSSGSLTQNMAFAYAQYNARIAVEVLAAYGLSDLDTRRTDPLAPLGKLRTDSDGHSTLLSASARLPIVMNGFVLAPYGRVTWERISRDSLSEGSTSQASLTAAHYSASGASVMAGLQGGSLERNPLATRVTYQFNLGVGRDDADLLSPDMKVTLAGQQFDIRSTDVGRAFVRGEVSGTLQLTPRLYGHLGVSTETPRCP